MACMHLRFDHDAHELHVHDFHQHCLLRVPLLLILQPQSPSLQPQAQRQNAPRCDNEPAKLQTAGASRRELLAGVLLAPLIAPAASHAGTLSKGSKVHLHLVPSGPVHDKLRNVQHVECVGFVCSANRINVSSTLEL